MLISTLRPLKNHLTLFSGFHVQNFPQGCNFYRIQSPLRERIERDWRVLEPRELTANVQHHGSKNAKSAKTFKSGLGSLLGPLDVILVFGRGRVYLLLCSALQYLIQGDTSHSHHCGPVMYRGAGWGWVSEHNHRRNVSAPLQFYSPLMSAAAIKHHESPRMRSVA